MLSPRVILALVLAAVWSSAIGPVRADNIGGSFVECAQLVEFVAPTPTDNGDLVLVGIGPGLYNAVGDTTHHRFPFAPGISIDATLASKLRALADASSFTCLGMKGGGDGLLTEVALLPKTQVCGMVERDRVGVFSINDKENFVHMELIAEAQALVSEPSITALLSALVGGTPACLNFRLDAAGVVDLITVDATVHACGVLEHDGELVVNGFVIGDADTSSESLLGTQAFNAAMFVLAPRGTEGCVDLAIVDTRAVSAVLNSSAQICGRVTAAPAGIQVDEVGIPSLLLTSAQADELTAAVGGSACLTLTITDNHYLGTLTTTPPPATPSPTPSPAPSVMTSLPTGSQGFPALPVALLAAVLLVLVAGYLLWRVSRQRRARGVPPADGAGAALAPEPELAPATEVAPLTPREQEVLSMLYQGLSNKEIGGRLFITESTAGVHVSNIMLKLGAKSRAEAAALAHRMGLTSYDGLQH